MNANVSWISRIMRSGLAIAALLGLPAAAPAFQAAEQSAQETVAFLTYQSRQLTEASEWLFTCGVTPEDREDRAAADRLVSLGPAALPAIEGAFALMIDRESQGRLLPNEGLILLAYASIRGPAGYPRLRTLLDDRRLSSVQLGISEAVAVSLGLSAYVAYRPWTVVPRNPPLFCGGGTRKDALNQSILAWEGNDPAALVTSLGPAARAALERSLDGKTWEALRGELWHGGARDSTGIGYRWLETEAGNRAQDTPQGAPSAEIEAEFVSAAGAVCGRRAIKFSEAGDGVRKPSRLDNPDIIDLLGFIASCATEKR